MDIEKREARPPTPVGWSDTDWQRHLQSRADMEWHALRDREDNISVAIATHHAFANHLLHVEIASNQGRTHDAAKHYKQSIAAHNDFMEAISRIAIELDSLRRKA